MRAFIIIGIALLIAFAIPVWIYQHSRYTAHADGIMVYVDENNEHWNHPKYEQGYFWKVKSTYQTEKSFYPYVKETLISVDSSEWHPK